MSERTVTLLLSGNNGSDVFYCDDDGMPLVSIKQLERLTGANQSTIRRLWVKGRDLESCGVMKRLGDMRNQGWFFRADCMREWLSNNTSLRYDFYNSLEALARDLLESIS